MITSYKITKKMLKGMAVDMYIELKAYTKIQGNLQFHVSDVYLSAEDYEFWHQALEKRIRKETKDRGWTEKDISVAVGWESLNSSPNSYLGEAIKPGYVLVDDERHARTIKTKKV